MDSANELHPAVSAKPTSKRESEAWWLVLGASDHQEFDLGPLAQHEQVFLGPLALWEAQDRREQILSWSVSGIVFWTERPGLLTQRIVDDWAARFPLARLLVIAGAWCDGEMRTGIPVRGVERWRWSDWRQAKSERWLHGSWRPRTTTVGDSHYQSHALSQSHSLSPSVVNAGDQQRMIVVIEASDRATFEPLADLVERAGYRALWVRDGQVLAQSSAELDASRCLAWIIDDAGDSEIVAPTTVADELSIEVLRLVNYPRRSGHEMSPPLQKVLGKPFDARLIIDWLETLRLQKQTAELL